MKQLPPEVLAAFLDVEVLSRIHTLLSTVGRLRMSDNLLDWIATIKSTAQSVSEAVDELAEHPDYYNDVFNNNWKQHFEPEENTVDA